MKNAALKIAVSAGEVSGDQHAAALVKGILSIFPETKLMGMGGDHLRSAGLELVVDSQKFGSVNGLDFAPILGKSLRAFFRMCMLLYRFRPHVLILVDYPEFNLRLARVAKFFGVRVLYFIPPKVWAWRSGRVRSIKKRTDLLALIFPFEKQFYEQHRYTDSIFVGHPFVQELLPLAISPDRERARSEFCQNLQLDSHAPVIALFPGSRKSEVDRLLPDMLKAVEEVRSTHPYVQAVINAAPTIPDSQFEKFRASRPWLKIVRGQNNDVLRHAHAGILKCGTCNLEASFLGLPFVSIYRGSLAAQYLLRPFIKIKTFSLVNILRPNTVVELMQEQVTGQSMSDELRKLLFDEPYRAQMKSGFNEVVQSLTSHDQNKLFKTADSTYDRTARLAVDVAMKTSIRKSSYRRLLTYLRPYKKPFFLACLCMIVFGASDGAVPLLIKHVLDGVFANQDKTLLYVLPALVILFSVIRALADFGQEYIMGKVGHSIVRDMRNATNRALLAMDPDYFISNSGADLLSRFTSDVVLVRNLLTTSLASVVRDSIRVTALVITAVYLDPFLALMALVVFPVGLLPVLKFGKRIRRLSKKGQESIGTLSAMVQESIQGNKVVKIFGREDDEQRDFEEENDRLNRTFIKSERVRAITGPINEVLAALAIGGVILYGGLSVIGGFRSQGEFVAFLIAVFLMYDPFKKLSRVHNLIQQGLSGAERVFEVLDAEPRVKEPVNPIALTASNTIELQNVTFSYAEDKEPALMNVSLIIPEKRKVALVGLSGAGKSTLVDLIPRFIDPSQGIVKLGGVDISRANLRDLRSRIAMVGQHTFLFNDTILANIAYGNSDASREQAIEAARAAYAYDFIMKLPQGFDTIIGESGLTLSGGERQRIAIARAILKDAPILVLDEATASLDNRSEREVQLAIEQLERDRTSVVIAHRLSTVRSAHLIVVLEGGKVIEQGTHDELLARKGSFAKLHAMQFAAHNLQSEAPVLN